MRKLLTGIGITVLSSSALANPMTCTKSTSQLLAPLSDWSKWDMGTCGPQLQKGLKNAWEQWVVKGMQDTGKMIGDAGNAVGKAAGDAGNYMMRTSGVQMLADAKKNWNNFASGANSLKDQSGKVLATTGGNIMNGFNSFMSDLHTGVAQKRFWKQYDTVAQHAQNMADDLARGGEKTKAIVSKSVTDGLAVTGQAVDTLTKGMMMAMMEAQINSGCAQVASFGSPRQYDALTFLRRMDQLFIADAFAAEGGSCKTRLPTGKDGCVDPKQMPLLACGALGFGGGVLAWELASLLLPGGFMKWGLSPNALKGAAWVSKFISSKGLLAAKGFSTAVIGAEKTAVAAEKLAEAGHAAGEMAKAGAAAAHALSQTQAAQNAGKVVTGFASGAGKAIHAVSQLPVIKQVNALQDGVANFVLNGTEKAVTAAVTKGKIIVNGRKVAATEKALNGLLAANKGARLLATEEDGKAVVKVLSSAGEELGSFPASDPTGKQVSWNAFDKTHRAGFEKIAQENGTALEHGSDGAGAAHTASAAAHGNYANIDGYHLLKGDPVPGEEGMHFVKSYKSGADGTVDSGATTYLKGSAHGHGPRASEEFVNELQWRLDRQHELNPKEAKDIKLALAPNGIKGGQAYKEGDKFIGLSEEAMKALDHNMDLEAAAMIGKKKRPSQLRHEFEESKITQAQYEEQAALLEKELEADLARIKKSKLGDAEVKAKAKVAAREEAEDMNRCINRKCHPDGRCNRSEVQKIEKLIDPSHGG